MAIKKGKVFIYIILLGLLFVGFFIPTDFILIKPGSAQDLSKMVTVEGADTDDQGKFFLVTVNQQSARLWHLVYGYLHPHIEVRRYSNVIPPGINMQEYRWLLDQWMQESKNTAKVIALRRAGYDVEIINEGAIVVGFLENSPSWGILEKGDIITAVDGKKAALTNEVISAVQNRHVGDPVKLTVRRGAEELNLTVTTAPHPDDAEMPALGVYISTLDWEPVFPIDVELETGKIGGPSAGLMFVLEILNQLLSEDLTGGKLIAGTGTMDINEDVGPIGGVFQKVIAAEREGAEYFFVPLINYEEAKTAAKKMTLVPVKNLQEALDFLDSLAAAGSSFQPDRSHGRILITAT